MDARSEIRDFLTSRRARITPEDVGLTVFGHRRVPGLRREEVATVAGVSIDYYNRMERGNLSGVSESVLDSLAAPSTENGRPRRRALNPKRGGPRPLGNPQRSPLAS